MENKLFVLAVILKYLMISAVSALCGLLGIWIHGDSNVFWRIALICFAIITFYNIGSVRKVYPKKDCL